MSEIFQEEATSVLRSEEHRGKEKNSSHGIEMILLFSSLARIQGEDATPRETHIFGDTNCAVNPESSAQIYSLMRGKERERERQGGRAREERMGGGGGGGGGVLVRK